MFRYVRFELRDVPAPKPQFGIIKNFHFSAGNAEQVMLIEGSPFGEDFHAPVVTDVTVPLNKVRLLAPFTPSKIVGIGLNYRAHAVEQGKPIPEQPRVFLKALNSLADPGDTIRLNRHCTEVHHEGELMVIIGKRCKNVSESAALEYVAGYTIANDVTDRNIQKEEPTYARGKGMDTFCPAGPFLVSGVDWRGKRIRTSVNGVLKQDGNTNDMIHSVPKLISFVSEFMTLLPGDALLTGTPAGVGRIKSGDRVMVEIDELGALENAVENQI